MGGARAGNGSMTPMTEHERQTLTKLCARISDEKNSDVFTELVTQLEVLLEKMSVRPPARA
jgi:hypothetical protein